MKLLQKLRARLAARRIHTAVGLLIALLAFAPGATFAADSATALRIAVVAHGSEGNYTYANAPQFIQTDAIFLEALKARNIQLQWVPVTTAAVAALTNESFASGKIDFAFYGDLPSVLLNGTGLRTQLIVPGSLGNNSYLVVPENSTAKRLQDLKGKRVALHRGRPWEVTFARLAAAQGLTLKDFKIVNLNPQAGAAAIASNNVDAYFTQSDALLLEKKGVGKTIWSTKQGPIEWRMRAELWGRQSFVEENSVITQLLADAAVRALHNIGKDENKTAYLETQSRLGLTLELLEKDVAQETISWKDIFNPLVHESTRAHYRAVVDHALMHRFIRKPIPLEELINTKFLEQAIVNLELEDYWQPLVEAK